jgi:phthalate 4,5-dioxygenase oxygenase subunit
VLKAELNETLTRTGPGTAMGDVFRSFWIPALLAEEVPAPNSAPVRVRLLGEDLVAFRDSTGKVGLLEEYCPHRQASLFFGRNEEGGLRCTYHGWKFDTAGTCLDMPNEAPESRFKEKVRAVSYPTQERGGVVWAYLGPRDRVPEMPKLEWAEIPDENRYITKVLIDCNYMQSMEGDIDSSHTAFLHGTLGGAVQNHVSNAFHRETLRKFSILDKSPKFFLVETDYGFMVAARRAGGLEHYYWRITQWMLPSYSLIPKEAGSVLQCNMRIPIDDNRHWFFRTQFYPDRAMAPEELYEYTHGGVVFPDVIPGTYIPVANLQNDFLLDRSLQRSGTFSGIKGIPAQDQSVTVSMGPIVRRNREHLGTSDAAVIGARRRLLRAAESLANGEPILAAERGDSYYVRAPALLVDRETPFDVGAAEAVDAANQWSGDVKWAQVEPVLET